MKRRTRFARVAATVLLAAGAGYGAAAASMPLPWMLGPLFATALLKMAGAPLAAPRGGRQVGQWMIGAALGLYFTPSVNGLIGGLAPYMVLSALVAMAIGFVSGGVLARLSGTPFVTAFYGSVPGGAAEMAVAGERHGAQVSRVAAAQSLRIVLVVSVIPVVYQALGVHGIDAYQPAGVSFSLTGFALLAASTGAGALLMHRARLPNAWVIGPLAVGIPLTAAGVSLSAVPREVSNAAQLLIGVALGSRFEREFVHSAPRYLAAVAMSVAVAMAISALFAAALVFATDVHWATLGLATAPGGIAEMALTAKVLQLGVPIVTAFHVSRVVMLVLFTAPVYRLLVGRRSQRDGRRR